MSQLTELIEREVEKQAGLPVFVEEDGPRLVITGIASSSEEKEAIMEVARAVAPDREIDDDIDLTEVMPDAVAGLSLSSEDIGGLRGTDEGIDAEGESLEPGDFTDQPLLVDP